MEELIYEVFRSVISPLATVKSLFRSPSGSRPGTFLCKSWRVQLNIKFPQEYQLPLGKALWEGIREE